jgi:hypothetical protein
MERLLSLIDALNKRAKVAHLDDLDRASLRRANESLAKLRRDEESEWTQCAKVKHIQVILSISI